MSPPTRPRLADVAARAGVSLKTASRALNGEYGVAPVTSDRVLAAARELGFRPNRLAQSLAGGRPSSAVGLLIPDVADPFVASVVGAVERVVIDHDLQVITASHGNDPQRQRRLSSALVERRVDALIVMTAPGPVDYLEPDLAHGLMVVALDRPLVGLDVDTVTVDNEAGVHWAVERLLALGHRRIAALGLDLRLWTVARRIDAYRSALLQAGIPVDEALVSTEHDVADLPAAFGRMLRSPDRPTAVLATGHFAVHAAMHTMREAGVTVDLAVIDSMDDDVLLATPPLLIVESGPDRLGEMSARLTLERLAGLQALPRHLILEPLMFDRGTGHAATGPTHARTPEMNG